jgi:hypothetical protein
MELKDEVLLLCRERAPLQIRPQVIDPSKPAALATAL